MSPVIEERLQQVIGRPILKGSHPSIDDGGCVMEIVSYVAGEPWSDNPACSCPVLGAFMRAWDDGMPDDETRTRVLAPFIVRLVGSKSSRAVERRRADLALDWFVRIACARWLDTHPTLKVHGDAFRALPPLLTVEKLASAQPTLAAAQPTLAAASKDAAAAWDAARDAARAAARDAAWAAAMDAARAATWDATRAAAMDAANKSAASGGAYEDQYQSAYAVCQQLFAPVTAELETSAIYLVQRMLAVTPESLTAEAPTAPSA